MKAQTMADDVRCKAHLAVSAVLAGSLLTLVLHPRLAVASRETNRAGACVVLPRVEARGPVVTRLVLRAEVEVDVAEVTSPSAVALARVRLAAGPVLAPGVDLALVAVGPRPPDAAPAREETLVRRWRWKNCRNARNGRNNGTGLVIFSSARLLNPAMAMLIAEPSDGQRPKSWTQKVISRFNDAPRCGSRASGGYRRKTNFSFSLPLIN